MKSGTLTKENIEKIVNLYESGSTLEEIGKVFNCTVQAIWHHLNKLGVPRRQGANRKFHFNYDFFEKIDTEEKAYWLGFLYADGHIRPSGEIILVLQNRDKDHLIKFNESIDSSYLIKTYFLSGHFSARLRLRHKKTVKDINNLGFGFDKTFKFQVNISKEFQRHFWRGIFDGDGSFFTYTNSSNSYLKSCLVGNKEEMLAFIQFIKNNGGPEMSLEKHKTIFAARAHGPKAWAIGLILYEDNRICLTRKYDKLKSFQGRYFPALKI